MDHSNSVCSVCGGKGVSRYYTKGMCMPCYRKLKHQEYMTDSSYVEKRRSDAKSWNRDHRDRFNEIKRNSYLRSKGVEVPLVERKKEDVVCAHCNELLPHFAKGLCLSCYGKMMRRLHFDTRRISYISKAHGITKDEYINLLAESNGICKICNKNVGDSKLVVDHDHETGKVRSLICNKCNLVLHKDRTPEILRSMATYLESHKEKDAKEGTDE